MTYKYDPTISSSAYLELARKRARYNDFPEGISWMLKLEKFDFGAHREHVDRLLDPTSWSASVIGEGRKPRVFIDTYINIKNNVEIRSIGGRFRVYFEDDWHLPMNLLAPSWAEFEFA